MAKRSNAALKPTGKVAAKTARTGKTAKPGNKGKEGTSDS